MFLWVKITHFSPCSTFTFVSCFKNGIFILNYFLIEWKEKKKSEKFNIFPACLCKWKKWVYQLVNYLWIFHSYFKLLRAYFKSLESCNSREKKNEEKKEKKFLPQSLYAAKLVSASETHWIFISIYIVMLFAASSQKLFTLFPPAERNSGGNGIRSNGKIQFCILFARRILFSEFANAK